METERPADGLLAAARSRLELRAAELPTFNAAGAMAATGSRGIAGVAGGKILLTSDAIRDLPTWLSWEAATSAVRRAAVSVLSGVTGLRGASLPDSKTAVEGPNALRGRALAGPSEGVTGTGGDGMRADALDGGISPAGLPGIAVSPGATDGGSSALLMTVEGETAGGGSPERLSPFGMSCRGRNEIASRITAPAPSTRPATPRSRAVRSLGVSSSGALEMAGCGFPLAAIGLDRVCGIARAFGSAVPLSSPRIAFSAANFSSGELLTEWDPQCAVGLSTKKTCLRLPTEYFDPW